MTIIVIEMCILTLVWLQWQYQSGWLSRVGNCRLSLLQLSLSSLGWSLSGHPLQPGSQPEQSDETMHPSHLGQMDPRLIPLVKRQFFVSKSKIQKIKDADQLDISEKHLMFNKWDQMAFNVWWSMGTEVNILAAYWSKLVLPLQNAQPQLLIS